MWGCFLAISIQPSAFGGITLSTLLYLILIIVIEVICILTLSLFIDVVDRKVAVDIVACSV